MKRYVFDSCALIALFDNEPGAQEVAGMMDEITVKNLDAYVCTVNIGEVYYHFLRTAGEETADKIMKAIQTLPLIISDADMNLTLAAARFKAHHKMSYADAFAAGLAEEKDAVLVTGDKEFKQLDKKIKIKWI